MSAKAFLPPLSQQSYIAATPRSCLRENYTCSFERARSQKDETCLSLHKTNASDLFERIERRRFPFQPHWLWYGPGCAMSTNLSLLCQIFVDRDRFLLFYKDTHTHDTTPLYQHYYYGQHIMYVLTISTCAYGVGSTMLKLLVV